MKTMPKLYELDFNMLPRPQYSPDLALNKDWLFADLQKMFQRKRFDKNKAIAATKGFFQVKDRSFYMYGFEKLRKCPSDYLALEGGYDDD